MHLEYYLYLLLLLSIYFYVNYISSLYSSNDLSKIDLKKSKNEERVNDLFFIFQNSYILYISFIYSQTIINYYSNKFLNVIIEKNEINNKVANIIIFSFAIVITLLDIIANRLASNESSKKKVLKKYFLMSAKSLIFPFYFLKYFFKDEEITNFKEDDIITLVSNLANNQIGLVENEEARLIASALRFDENIIDNYFIKDEKIVYLDYRMNLSEIINIIERFGYSRYPVKNGEKIEGIFIIKYLMTKGLKGKNINKWQDLIENEICKLNKRDTLRYASLKIKDSKSKMALVFNEKNSFIGIITWHDIISTLI